MHLEPHNDEQIIRIAKLRATLYGLLQTKKISKFQYNDACSELDAVSFNLVEQSSAEQLNQHIEILLQQHDLDLSIFDTILHEHRIQEIKQQRLLAQQHHQAHFKIIDPRCGEITITRGHYNWQPIIRRIKQLFNQIKDVKIAEDTLITAAQLLFNGHNHIGLPPGFPKMSKTCLSDLLQHHAINGKYSVNPFS